MKTSSKDGAKIYVGNLPPRCTERDVEDLCKQFGSVERADIVKNFAFVVGLGLGNGPAFSQKSASHLFIN